MEGKARSIKQQDSPSTRDENPDAISFMAPLPTGIARTMLEVSTRDIGDNTNEGQSVSESEGLITQKLSLTFATVSVASSVLAFYWFVRMRRSFRHE